VTLQGHSTRTKDQDQAQSTAWRKSAAQSTTTISDFLLLRPAARTVSEDVVMALFATTSNPSLARTRSLRPPTKPPLTAPPQQHSGTASSHASATTSAGNTGSTGSIQSSSNNASTAIPSSTSNLALFLTNLRLLDLDCEPDWPDITAATFSARDAAGGQKKRIHAVEWALYQLFAIWDPSETQNKLRPFYPPLDQVQSVNLRAALTRSLEQLKRNGFLGRDAIIRKTMLDECKGERLEEVFAAFSSAVLKKLVAERSLNDTAPEHRAPIAERLAIENRGYTGERTELNGLLLAHKVSLTGALARKNEERSRYHDFEELLEFKQRGLVRRREQVENSATSQEDDSAQLDDQTRREAQDILRTNWTGNESWVDTLLYDGAGARPTGTLLDAPFEEVWRGVQEGRLSDLEGQGTDLLGTLDNRVRLQKSRLEKWETFHHKMFGAAEAAPVTPARKQDRPRRIIEFRAHKDVHLTSARQKPSVSGTEMPAEYEQIMLNMDKKLSSVGQAKIPNFAKMFGSTAARLGAATRAPELEPEPVVAEPVSDLSDWEDEHESPVVKRAVEAEQQVPAAQATRRPRSDSSPRRKASGRPLPARQNSSRQLGRARKISVQEYDYEVPAEDELDVDTSPFESDQIQQTPTPATRYAHPDSYDRRRNGGLRPRSPSVPDLPPPTSPSPPAASPTQAAADEILAYMSNASPSPMKKIPRHTLSLAERTRLSMVRTPSFEADESGSGRLSPGKADYPTIVEEAADPADNDDAAGQGTSREDLIARTRRSMAGFEAARQKAQLDRRRSQKKSKATPRKDGSGWFTRVDEEEEKNGPGPGDISVVDELLLAVDEEGGDGGAGAPDYEAVFRSRPKIKISPAASPMRRWDEE